MADASSPAPDAIEIPGPWQHRHVAANGARFHVAESVPSSGSDRPLVLLLHGFPEFWWAWRHQLPTLAAAGYRAAAMDLRGYGGSDKTPDGYDPVTLAQDVSGVVKALGERSAVLVGHGWGGYVAWATAVLHAREVSALCAVAAPHPATMLAALRPGPSARRRANALAHVLAMQVPVLPERRLSDPSTGYLESHLRSWASPTSTFPDAAELATYQRAIGLWPAPHCALEYHRWLVRSLTRTDGRRFRRLMRRPVSQPVLCVGGADDPAVPVSAAAGSRPHVIGEFDTHMIDGVGHFCQEEAPQAFDAALLSWLRRL